MVALLEPFLSEITDKDRWGNTAVHVAAAECNYDLLKFLAHRANLEVRKVPTQNRRRTARSRCVFLFLLGVVCNFQF